MNDERQNIIDTVGDILKFKLVTLNWNNLPKIFILKKLILILYYQIIFNFDKCFFFLNCTIYGFILILYLPISVKHFEFIISNNLQSFKRLF